MGLDPVDSSVQKWTCIGKWTSFDLEQKLLRLQLSSKNLVAQGVSKKTWSLLVSTHSGGGTPNKHILGAWMESVVPGV